MCKYIYIYIVLNSTEVETVTKEQTLTKNKRFIQFEKGESSKTLPNNK